MVIAVVRTFRTARRRPHGDRPGKWIDEIDPVGAVKGASTGFTILLLGGLLEPIAGSVLPVLGSVWLTVTALVAFASAASRIGSATRPSVHGALAAVSAYLLIVPLVLMTPAGRDITQMSLTVTAAAVVGACSGYVGSRWRDMRRGASE